MTGGCACGAIRYEVTCEPLAVYACHCTECQRQSSSAFALAAPVPRASYRITQGDLGVWSRVNSRGITVRSWFCRSCATRIYGDRDDRATINIRAGTLDDTRWIERVAHLWTRSKQPWLHLDPDEPAHPSQPDDFRAFLSAHRRQPGA
jgi:hypothetical protein